MITRVSRPPWTPKTDEQRQAIAALRRAVAAANRARKKADEADEEVWRLAQAARAVKVSATFIANEIGPNRATLYRHVPAKKSVEGQGE
jgi:hypothetical protein